MLLTDNRWPPDVAQPDAADLIAAGCIGAAAHQALRREAGLTPKPGLVDRRNSGAHRDMDIHTFMHSADAIGAGFTQFVLAGARHAALPAEHILPLVRPLGLQYEQAMFAATGGVNTHKGGIFALGLLCTAAGRLLGRGAALLADALCTEVAAICSGLVERELGNQNAAQTAGSSCSPATD